MRISSDNVENQYDLCHNIFCEIVNPTQGGCDMAVSYKRLWKLLIDKDMKKCDLEREAGITHYALGKLSKGKDVSTEVLGKICSTLNCTIDDIMEFVPEKETMK